MNNSFSSFSHFMIICIFIMQCISQSVKIDEEVQDELSIFTGILNGITDLKTRDTLQMKLTQLIERTIKAEKKCEEEMRLEKEMENLFSTIAMYSCGKDLQHRMDKFYVDYIIHGANISKSSVPLQEPVYKIKKTLIARIVDIQSCVIELGELYEKYSPETMLSTVGRTSWTNRVKAVYRDLRNMSITTPIKTNDWSLINSIVRFQAAGNETDAVNEFKKQCYELWCPWDCFNLNDNYDKLKDLVMQIPDNEKRSLLKGSGRGTLSSRDYSFLNDMFETRTYFVTRSDRFKGCPEVFYFLQSENIEKLKKQLEEHWPGVDFANRVNKFCSAFAMLYDKISMIDYHKYSAIDEVECKSNSTHYYRYLDNLVLQPDAIDDVRFVSKVLGAIDYDHTSSPSTIRTISPYEWARKWVYSVF